MEIDFSKFSKDLQAKIKAAFDNDKNIDDTEAAQLGLSKEVTAALNKKLSEGLSNKANENVGDSIEIKQRDEKFTYTLKLKNPNATEGELTWGNEDGNDSLAKIRTVYPNAHTPYLKDGVVTILDKKGNPVLDKNGLPVQTDFIPKPKVFSEELAELLVLGHKADPMERLMHQAEIKKKLDELNNNFNPNLDYAEVMQSIAFEQMNKKEQTEALLKISGEKFYKAIQNKDYGTAKEYLLQGFGLAFQKMDMASIGNTNISIEGFKDFLKHWSGLDAFCEKMDEVVNDNSDNLTTEEKIWEFTKGVGDAVDHFIGTQGVAFIGTLALASEAAAAGGFGELWAVATQAYFGYEGIGSIAEGVNTLQHAQTAEDYRISGDMVGTGAIMLHGAVKSFKGALTGRLQAGLEVKEAIKEIRKAESIEEIKELQDNLPDLPYNSQERQVLMMECLKRTNEIVRQGVNEGVNEGVKDNTPLQKEMDTPPQPSPLGEGGEHPTSAKNEPLTPNPSPTRGEGNRPSSTPQPTTSPTGGEGNRSPQIPLSNVMQNRFEPSGITEAEREAIRTAQPVAAEERLNQVIREMETATQFAEASVTMDKVSFEKYKQDYIENEILKLKANICEKLGVSELPKKYEQIIEEVKSKYIVFKENGTPRYNFSEDAIIKLGKIGKLDRERLNYLLGMLADSASDDVHFFRHNGNAIADIMKLSKEQFEFLDKCDTGDMKKLNFLHEMSCIKPENFDRIKQVYSNPKLLEQVRNHKFMFDGTFFDLKQEIWNSIFKRNLLEICNGEITPPGWIYRLAEMSDTKFEKAKSRGLVNCSAVRVAESLMKLTDEQYNLVVKTGAYDESTGYSKIGLDMEQALNLSPTAIDRLTKYDLFGRVDKNDIVFTEPIAIKYAQMEDAEFQAIVDRGLFDVKINDKPLSLKQISSMLMLSESDCKKIINDILPLGEDMTINTAKEFLTLTDEQLALVKEFNLLRVEVAERDGGVFGGWGSIEDIIQSNGKRRLDRIAPSNVRTIVRLVPRQLIPTVLDLLKMENIKRFNIQSVINIAKLPDAERTKAVKMILDSPRNDKALEQIIKYKNPQNKNEHGEVDSETYFDDVTYNQILKFRSLLPKEMCQKADRYVSCFNAPNGTYNIEAAERFLELAKDFAKNPNFKGHTPFEILSGDYGDFGGYTKADIDSKFEVYNLVQNIGGKEELLSFNPKTAEFYETRIAAIFSTTAKTLDVIKSVITDADLMKNNTKTAMKFLSMFNQNYAQIFNGVDIKETFAKVEAQRKKALENPERYINGELPTRKAMEDRINGNFDELTANYCVVAEVFDKEAFNHLLRLRLNEANSYMFDLCHFSEENIVLVKRMGEGLNIDGKPFLPAQKVEFIDLVDGYEQNGLSTKIISDMLEQNEGKLDLAQLQKQLFAKIMENAGMTKEEIAATPLERLVSWDTKYAHFLAKAIKEEGCAAYGDIIRAGNLEPDFMKYIHNTDNIYGQINAKTKAKFQELRLNYDKWLKPDKKHEIKFYAKDKNAEQLEQIGKLLVEDIETLRRTPVKGFIDKQFKNCIKEGKFVIPSEVLSSKAKMNEFINNVIKQLDTVWKRAEANAANPESKPEIAQRARNTLTIFDHLKQRLESVKSVENSKITKTVDVTIKMWDRNPRKDIFQGNYSTCCIAVGGGNGRFMPHYVLNTAFNMIEIVDNVSGKPIGNALCYYIIDGKGKPAFVLDNIEINDGQKPSIEVCDQIRDLMAEYAQKISKDITGDENISVYLGGQFNDVSVESLPKTKEKIEFVGEIDRDNIYVDLYEGEISREELYGTEQELLILK